MYIKTEGIVILYPNFNYKNHMKTRKEAFTVSMFCTGTEETMFSIKRQTDLVSFNFDISYLS